MLVLLGELARSFEPNLFDRSFRGADGLSPGPVEIAVGSFLLDPETLLDSGGQLPRCPSIALRCLMFTEQRRDSRSRQQGLLSVHRHVDHLGVETQHLHDPVALRKEVPVSVYVVQQPVEAGGHGGVHLPGKAQIPAPLHQLANHHDEQRGLLGVTRVGDTAIGGNLVQDPAIAVCLGRLAPQQPKGLPGHGVVSRH